MGLYTIRNGDLTIDSGGKYDPVVPKSPPPAPPLTQGDIALLNSKMSLELAEEKANYAEQVKPYLKVPVTRSNKARYEKAQKEVGDIKGRPGEGFIPGEWEVDERADGESLEEYAARVAAPLEPTRMEGETDEEFSARVLDSQIEQYHQNAGSMLQYNGDPRTVGMSGRPGFAEATRQIAQDVDRAAVGEAEGVSQVYENAAPGMEEANAAQARMIASHRALLEESQKATQAMIKAESEARKRVEAMPELDKSRFFRSMTSGQKFLAILGGIAGGWNGSSKTVDLLMDLADRDLEEQKSAYEMARNKYDMVRGATDQITSIYGQMADRLGQEAADPIFQKMVLQDMKFQLERTLASSNIPTVNAERQKISLALEEAIRATEAQAQLVADVTPKKITKWVESHPDNPEIRKNLAEQAKMATAHGYDVRMKNIESNLDRQKQADKFAFEAEAGGDEARRKAFYGDHGPQSQIEKFTDKTADVQTFFKTATILLDDIDNGTDVAGIGFGSSTFDWGRAEERDAVLQRVNDLVDLASRGRSGAGMTDSEAERLKAIVANTRSDASFKRGLRQVMQTIANKIEAHYAIMDDDAKAEFRRRTTGDPGMEALLKVIDKNERIDLPDAKLKSFLEPRTKTPEQRIRSSINKGTEALGEATGRKSPFLPEGTAEPGGSAFLPGAPGL